MPTISDQVLIKETELTTSKKQTISLPSSNSSNKFFYEIIHNNFIYFLVTNMTLISAVGLLKHVEINLLKQKIKSQESSEAFLKTFYEKEIET